MRRGRPPRVRKEGGHANEKRRHASWMAMIEPHMRKCSQKCHECISIASRKLTPMQTSTIAESETVATQGSPLVGEASERPG